MCLRVAKGGAEENTIIKGDSRPGFGLVEKDRVLEVRGEGL